MLAQKVDVAACETVYQVAVGYRGDSVDSVESNGVFAWDGVELQGEGIGGAVEGGDGIVGAFPGR